MQHIFLKKRELFTSYIQKIYLENHKENTFTLEFTLEFFIIFWVWLNMAFPFEYSQVEFMKSFGLYSQ